MRVLALDVACTGFLNILVEGVYGIHGGGASHLPMCQSWNQCAKAAPHIVIRIKFVF